MMPRTLDIGTRVTIISDLLDRGRIGTVLGNRPDGGTVIVLLDGDAYSLQWHYSHTEAVTL